MNQLSSIFHNGPQHSSFHLRCNTAQVLSLYCCNHLVISLIPLQRGQGFDHQSCLVANGRQNLITRIEACVLSRAHYSGSEIFQSNAASNTNVPALSLLQPPSLYVDKVHPLSLWSLSWSVSRVLVYPSAHQEADSHIKDLIVTPGGTGSHFPSEGRLPTLVLTNCWRSWRSSGLVG